MGWSKMLVGSQCSCGRHRTGLPLEEALMIYGKKIGMIEWGLVVMVLMLTGAMEGFSGRGNYIRPRDVKSWVPST